VQDDEQVVVVLVELRALVAREDVLVVERVELEALLQPRLVDRPRTLDVDPAEAGASTISTRGSSRSGVRSAVRDRAERRPKGDRGRLGMARTERLVGGRRHDSEILRARPFSLAGRLLGFRAQSSKHPEGWRDWPIETPPTIPRKRETVAIPSGSKTTAWEMRSRRRTREASLAYSTGGGFTYAG